MNNFYLSKKLLEKMNIIADEKIFSIMFNYILNKCHHLYDNEFMIDLKLSLYYLHRKYKDTSTLRKNIKIANEDKTIEFIKHFYKNVFAHINISIFLKMNLIYFKDNNIKFNNYKQMTKFFDHIFIKYGINNYIDYLYHYNKIKDEILNFGGIDLKEDIDKLFNGLGLNVLYNILISGMTNMDYFFQFEELNPHSVFEPIELDDKQKEELSEYIKMNKKLCNYFDSNNKDEQQIQAAKTVAEYKNRNK